MNGSPGAAPRLDVADWLERLLPQVAPHPQRGGCWVAQTKTMSSEHHPPYHWLTRALEAAERRSALAVLAERARAAHPGAGCGALSEADQRVQDALSIACACAWAADRLGEPALDASANGAGPLVRVPALGAVIVPRRLWPARTIDGLLEQITRFVAEADADAGPPGAAGAARARIFYLDLCLSGGRYAQDAGYDGPITEPLRAWTKQLAAERGMGWVVTRPFQWGVPIEEWY